MKYFNIRISEDTKRMLDAKKHEGQSYNGLVRELLGKHDKKLAKRKRKLEARAKKQQRRGDEA